MLDGIKVSKIIMKKLLILFCALFTLTIAANAANDCYTPAFASTYESIEVHIYSNGHVHLNGNYIATYRKNPYANSNMCAPDMNWSTCYKYCFSYNGKTYFFNSCLEK